MLLDIRQEGVAAKLMAIAAMLALSLGIIFIGKGQAYADPDQDPDQDQNQPAVMISEVRMTDVIEPEIGGTPNSSGHLQVFFSNDVIYIGEDSTAVYKPDPMIDDDQDLSWWEDNVPMVNDELFAAGHTYKARSATAMVYVNSLHQPGGINIENAKNYINDAEKGTPTASNTNGNYWIIGMTSEWTLYGISFDPNGGVGESKTETVYEKTTTLPENDTYTKFAREGYTFAGWSTTKDGEVEYADDGSFTFPEDSATATLYAQWAPVAYKVTVTADPAEGGTASADKQEAATGDTVTLSATPNDGYEFLEWVTVTEGVTIEDGKFTMPASDVEVQATFKEKPKPVTVTHTVAFDANGGTGSMDAIEGEEGTETTLTANKFTRDGYTFEGWNTKADGSGTAYADSAKIKLDADITLYAQWEKNASSPSSTKATSSSNSRTLANTGDSLPVALIALPACTALAAIAVLALARRRIH